MSLGMHSALQADADEFLREHKEEVRQRRKSLSVSGEQARPKSPLAPKVTTPPVQDVSPILPPQVNPSSPDPDQGAQSPHPQSNVPSAPSPVAVPSQDPPPRQTDITFALPPKTIAFHEPAIPKPAKAMSSIYGKRKTRISLPGDLGPNDPRRKPKVASKSTSPVSRVPYNSTQHAARRRASDAPPMPKAFVPSPEKNVGAPRLEKDAVGSGADAVDSSDDDKSDDDVQPRGRQRDTRKRSPELAGETPSDSDDADTATDKEDAGREKDPPQSPNITVTPPHPEYHRHKQIVHPHSAYDHGVSAASTPMHSDDEEHLSDVRRAQRLTLTVSPIHSTPSAHRTIRQIIRGDYVHLQSEAEQGHRRQRVYLVATDLSPEAEYALEWTIGTILRDGDTLLALYAVDEESSSGGSDGVEIGHGAESIRDTADIVHNLPAERLASGAGKHPLSKSDASAKLTTPRSKAENQRFQATTDISDRCIRLLRKTRLQVRVVVEVFHCKSPRHMITEVVRLSLFLSLPIPSHLIHAMTCSS